MNTLIHRLVTALLAHAPERGRPLPGADHHPERAFGIAAGKHHEEVTVNPTTKKLGLIALVFGTCVSASLWAQPVERLDWSAHFRPGGAVIPVVGVVDAVFLEDKISDGLGVDMSVTVDPGRSLVDNGVVLGSDDLGNGYLLARTDGLGSLIYHVGVERIASAADTWVEFELNQGVVQVRSGVPWPIHGERKAGDLLVRVTYAAGALAGADLYIWNGLSFQAIASAPATGPSCSDLGTVLVFCDGPLPLKSAQQQTWDAQYLPVQVAPPNAFVEIGVNVTGLLGKPVEFSTIQVKTPRDIILDSFRKLGYWKPSPVVENGNE